jgi:hypothetical protein
MIHVLERCPAIAAFAARGQVQVQFRTFLGREPPSSASDIRSP